MFKEICMLVASVAVVVDILNGSYDVWDHVIIEAKSLDCFPACMLPSPEYHRSDRGPMLGHPDLIVTPYRLPVRALRCHGHH